ncbi:purine and uridine phosphorylase [Aspergillus cavernicola]|uniref:Purine and uridine phosphorylase n=1 Tax=Aspergillus cavernicola TaxID=176166 RepID=A0ABR4INU5_9EURO
MLSMKMNQEVSPFQNDKYQIAWICSNHIEMLPASEMLDREFGEPQIPLKTDKEYAMTLGIMGNHKIVILNLLTEENGDECGSALVAELLAKFPQIRFGVMVGVGAGIPDYEGDEVRDIRVGDVVVGSYKADDGGVFVYDGWEPYTILGTFNAPPRCLRPAVVGLQTRRGECMSRVSARINNMLEKRAHMAKTWRRPDATTDLLYRSGYDKDDGGICSGWKEAQEVSRRDWERRSTIDPFIHCGGIAISSESVEDGRTRDRIHSIYPQVFCLDNDLSGVETGFPCLVIRGISNYADTHRNGEWLRYAAAAAAAFGTILLHEVSAMDVAGEPTAVEVIQRATKFLHAMSTRVNMKDMHI